jgi:hypothetical protein
MTSKQLVNQLYNNMTQSLDFTDEQVQLIIKLAQSIETDEERLVRIKHFNLVAEKALQDGKKYNNTVA